MKENLEGMKALWAIPQDAWPSNENLAQLKQAYKDNNKDEVTNTLKQWMQPWSDKNELNKDNIPAIMNFFEKAGTSDNATKTSHSTSVKPFTTETAALPRHPR